MDKLKWQPGTGLISYVADGREYSYQIAFDALTEKYVVLKLRQPGGQAVNRSFALTVEGAMARGQVWENGE